MILRILGEGQFEVDDTHLDELNRLDDELVAAVETGDDEAFRTRLETLIDRAHAIATPVAADYLGPSDCALPGADATLAEVRELLGDEGLIPG
ncbi:MAG TPA: hypothetical protein VNT56_03110 [Acidimicrobiales bacterium]|nr:hypothetical protein [Acidimicrobiales bacterium]